MTDRIEKDLLAARDGRDVSFFDLYSIDQLSQADIDLILDLARAFRAHETYKFAFNKGCSMVNAFFESSTRTMSSFDLSAKQLSMDTSNVGSSSSTNKGESFLDTVETLDSYNLKVIVVRTKESGVAQVLARHVGASIINAGDGWHEHPTQGLLDALTMLDRFKAKSLSGKTITIVGDVMHSRVAGSLIRIIKKLKGDIRIAAPQTFVPAGIENFGLKVFHSLEDALEGADVVYALRVQEERGAAGFIPTLREYSKMYGISKVRLDLAKPKAMLMHAGPVRRDIDVHSALVTLDNRSHILQQVENGMAVRKALLWLLANRMDGRVKEAHLR
ncbi:MAG: aspartate carbamoyltransferase catalytic subunit [Rhodospirillales bacterium]|nr:aspartate carbamoyltransferase catalytic subunit [Rhodospirillales bacterium]USO08462.1 MAG: aspartate carbamoyltransferase catalytic subunit [Rhodospirillales bacterium]